MSTVEDTAGPPPGGSRSGARRARGSSKTPPKHQSVAERAAIGKAARAEVPRSSHAELRALRRPARPDRPAGAPGGVSRS